MKDSSKKLLVNIAITLFSVIIGFVLLEVSAKIVWQKKYNQWLEKHLHGFDHVDYKRSIVILNANTKITVGQHRADLVKHGKTIGLKNFEESIRHDVFSDSAVLFKINKYGFKGPEISLPKPNSVYRILTIGNSCTWGPENDYYAYPRIIERELNRLVDKKCKFEVVNAGAYGYNFEKVIKRIDEFLAIEPDLITIYLGWNRTIGRADPKKNNYLYRKFSLYKIYYHFVINRKDTGLQENYQTKTFYDKNDLSLVGFKTHSFKYDINNLNTLVDIIKKKDKTIKVIIITLAGIFDLRVKIDKRTLKVALPIASTNNLYAYPLLTKKYNDELRRYAQIHQLDVIDFETYALNNFVPRSAYFKDSVHPTIEGYLKMGEYFASELSKYISFRSR